jgi:hypothetical protein
MKVQLGSLWESSSTKGTRYARAERRERGPLPSNVTMCMWVCEGGAGGGYPRATRKIHTKTVSSHSPVRHAALKPDVLLLLGLLL